MNLWSTSSDSLLTLSLASLTFFDDAQSNTTSIELPASRGIRWDHPAAKDRTSQFYRPLESPYRRVHLVDAPNGRIRRVLAFFPPVILPPTTPLPTPHSYSASFRPESFSSTEAAAQEAYAAVTVAQHWTLPPRLQTETANMTGGALSSARPLVKVSAARSRVGTLLPRLQTETTTTNAGALSWARP